MIYFDRLRPPPPFDPWAVGYKDWLHLNIADHASGSLGLINVSLHGAPDDPRSRAIGAALVHVPGQGWFGNLEILNYDQASIGVASIGLERVAMAADYPSGSLAVSVLDLENELRLSLNATPAAAPIIVEEPIPLGPGWISWYAMPRLTLTGSLIIGQQQMNLDRASGYHDHNWGRWHWGDDLGWEWGCFLTPAPGAVFALSRTTDRGHRKFGKTTLTVQARDQRRSFTGSSVELSYGGSFEKISRRVPGALAALHQDYAQLRLPRNLRISANDGIDQATLEFTGHSIAQLIVGDPIHHGYGFIHEIVGEFTCTGRLGDLEIFGKGLGVIENVC